jgi:lipopolysaccharide export system protein LptA
MPFNPNRSFSMRVFPPLIASHCAPLLFLLLILIAAPAFSADPAAKPTSKAPINIEADRMVSLEQKDSVLFSGNVIATQADVRIRADEMTVFYAPAGTGQGQEVTKINCVGKVEVTRGDWLGTGKKMDYLASERKVVLSGGARAWQGKNQVVGETITYFMDEGRSEVTPSEATTGNKGGRVNATIIPKK